MFDRRLDIYDFHPWFTLQYKKVQTIVLSTIPVCIESKVCNVLDAFLALLKILNFCAYD
jgi:hypothetical protein